MIFLSFILILGIWHRQVRQRKNQRVLNDLYRGPGFLALMIFLNFFSFSAFGIVRSGRENQRVVNDL
jgi:hypothetical protein